MTQLLHIKNMVCNRCIATVLHEFNVLGYDVKAIELGQVVFEAEEKDEFVQLEAVLKGHGFEIIRNEAAVLVESIKTSLVKKMEANNEENLSDFLTERFKKSYAVLSKTFSKREGITIEKYEINLRIEKAKELIQLKELNFSEIAYSLNYKNSSHLAKQFKMVTGMSMTTYSNLKQAERKTLDQIV